MDHNDDTAFGKILSVLGECFNKEVSQDMFNFYFEALRDVSIEVIKRNALLYINTAGKMKFPIPGDLRDSGDSEAIDAWNTINRLIDAVYDPAFHMASMMAIKSQLESHGKSHYWQFVQQWGNEILDGSNPTATRAQFLKHYQAQKQIALNRQLQGKDVPRQIAEMAKKMLAKSEESKN